MDRQYVEERAGAVAVVGMAGRWPGADSTDALWNLLVNQHEAVSRFEEDDLEFDVRKTLPEDSDQKVVAAGGMLENADLFDAAFFSIYPKEAELMDPQHRLFLECAWEALEEAGYNPESIPGLVGVFAGSNPNSYLMFNLCKDRREAEQIAAGCHPSKYQLNIGNSSDFLSSRVAYKFNLKGPAMTVQSACSTSLVSVNQACMNLLTYQCDMALAGGAGITFPQRRNYLYDPGGMLSGDGYCRPFDAQAMGTVFGSGLGVVVLKRLEDALRDGDQVRAVILGSAINNDGSDKIGFAAPSVNQQAEVVRLAQEIARVAPESISYVEAHGTGTPLGDPIEVAALTRAFRAGTDKRGFCALGSVKANIGHMDSGAGIAGLIKTVLCLEREVLPPILHFTTPNPHIDFDNSPFYPLKEAVSWTRGDSPRRAGVSSLGVGGTNAHAILEEAPEIDPGSDSRPLQTFVLSARSDTALATMRRELAARLRESDELDLADVGYTLKCGRKRFEHRLSLVCRSREEAVDKLDSGNASAVHIRKSAASGARVAFLFPGQGAQYPGMGRKLYENEAVFREAVDRCAGVLQDCIGEDIRNILYPDGGDSADHVQKINRTQYTQPCIFVVEYALAELWMSWGIKPDLVLGHSIGEYVAAVLSGVFSLETALRIIAERARLIQSLPGGTMLAVGLSEADVQSWLSPDLSVAAVNGPAVTVVSGPEDAIQGLSSRLDAEEIFNKVLATSHGFHSAMMDPILDEFGAFVQKYEMGTPQLDWISTLTGCAVTGTEVCAPDYWVRQIREPVRFSDAVEILSQSPKTVLLEVGPGAVLGALALQHPSHNLGQSVISSLSRTYTPEEDYTAVMMALGDLWASGVEPDWDAFYAEERRLRVWLPAYPFERKRFWVDPPAQSGAGEESVVLKNSSGENAAPDSPKESAEKESCIKDSGQSEGIEKQLGDLILELSGLDMISMGDHVTFSEVGIDSLLALRLFSELEKRFGVTLPLASLVEAPTIPALAERIRSGSGGKNFVVAMTQEVVGKNLFLIHAAEGGILFYKDFAHELRSVCSVYGLEAPWLMSEEVRADSMEEVASFYLKLIREVQPEGPYMIAGFCYGGVVAFEMAQQLHAAGETVSSLVMFDTNNPLNLPQRYGAWKRLGVNLKLIRGKGIAEQFSILAGRGFGKLRAQRNAFMAKFLYRKGQMMERVTGQESVDKKVAEMHDFHERLFFEYKPKPYDGDIVLIEGMDREPMYDYPENLGWTPVIKGDLRDYKLQVEHLSMLQYPSAVDVATVVSKEIDGRT